MMRYYYSFTPPILAWFIAIPLFTWFTPEPVFLPYYVMWLMTVWVISKETLEWARKRNASKHEAA